MVFDYSGVGNYMVSLLSPLYFHTFAIFPADQPASPYMHHHACGGGKCLVPLSSQWPHAVNRSSGSVKVTKASSVERETFRWFLQYGRKGFLASALSSCSNMEVMFSALQCLFPPSVAVPNGCIPAVRNGPPCILCCCMLQGRLSYIK